MEAKQILWYDWQRIFIGEIPPSFFIEVLIRIAFIYLLLIVSIRLMGKRMSAQLSRNETAAVTSLAAAIGMPLQAPERGLLPAVVIAVVVILVGRGMSLLAFKSERFEKLSQGRYGKLVTDAVLDLKTMKRVRVTRERLFATLRGEGVKHLGEVQRLYMEANGSFSLVKAEVPTPGLSILPDWDKEFLRTQTSAPEIAACCSCGYKTPAPAQGTCPECREDEWGEAVC